MLTYMEVHLYFTLPVLGVLFYILKPFHSSSDTIKYQFLTLVAFTTASLWDNYIVYHRAWSYCPTCVVAVIGYVPLEEYMFFIIMTLMTVAFTNLVMRWKLHSFYVKPNTPIIQSLVVRFVPIIGFLTIAYKAWHLAIPATSLFYGSCILWYACPVLALLWYSSGEYMLRCPVSVLISIAVPTVFLCWVDQFAIARGTWSISLRTSTGKMVVSDLPVEEFMFFALINSVLVFATCTIDRALAIAHLYKTSHVNDGKKNESAVFLKKMSELLWGFGLPDQMLDSEPLNDLTTSWNILRSASKSFHTASAVFPCNVRQDLGVLYGFCRATDDLCDNEDISVEERKDQLELTRRFVKDLFSQKSNTPQAIDWDIYRESLSESCISAFRSFTRLRNVLEVDAVEELLNGYKWDLECRPILDENDLREYSACVASSVGEMCTRIILHSDSSDTYSRNNEWIVGKARDMGLVLQYINIARDIATDSEKLGRCYLPKDWLNEKEYELIGKGKVRDISDARLLKLSMSLVRKANIIMVEARKAIEQLPVDCQSGVRAACNVYAAIGDELRKQNDKGIYPTRAHVTSWGRARIAFLSVYNQSNQ